MPLPATQLLIPGLPSPPEVVYSLYHDESGTYSPGTGDRWLLHGVLLVPELELDKAYGALQHIRRQHTHFSEVHFVKLRGHINGPKARCAMGWLDCYGSQLSDTCFYHCLAIDTHSPGFDPGRFGQPHHAYNRFACMAMEGAIAWSLARHKRIAVKFHSDEKSRESGDNFAKYTPRQLHRSLVKKRAKKPSGYPEFRLLHPEVVQVVSDPAKVPASMMQACEMIQLVDLITSDVAQALTGRSGQLAKIALAEVVGRWIEDTRKPPWLQTQDLHRRFSVSCFPDAKGNFYNPTLAVVDGNQPKLFSL